jgi:ADP-ribosyl-[dinitrogen reductase] hydrolase
MSMSQALGSVAARLLIELGESPTVALKPVRAARPGAVETREQEAYVLGVVA